MHKQPQFYQALLGRQPHLLPQLGGGYFGDLDVKGQNNLARVREIVAVAIIEATIEVRLQRSDKHNQVVALERAEHRFGDLVDIWCDPPNNDILGWRGFAQIANVQFSDGNVTVRSQG